MVPMERSVADRRPAQAEHTAAGSSPEGWVYLTRCRFLEMRRVVVRYQSH